MRRPSLLAFVLVVFALLASVAIASEGWTPELIMKVKRVGNVRVSPDGGWVAFVVGEAVMDGEKSEWVNHIYLAETDGSRSF